MGSIDTVGTYILEIVEQGISTTKEGKPQLVLKSKALQKYVDDKDSMTHFGITEPAYVDWSSYGEESTDFLLLFNSVDTFDASTAMLNYEQAQKAFKWAGDSFDTIAKIGDKFLGRFKEETYKDKVSIKLTWIDAADANPVHTIKKLDVDGVSALNKLLKAGIGKSAKPAAVAAAKPVVAKPALVKPSPAVVNPAAAPASSPASSAVKPVTTPTTAPKSPSKATPPPPKPEVDPATDGLPREISQNDAWEYVISKKGDTADADLESAWLSACSEIGAGRQEAQFTTADWAKIRDITIKDLAL